MPAKVLPLTSSLGFCALAAKGNPARPPGTGISPHETCRARNRSAGQSVEVPVVRGLAGMGQKLCRIGAQPRHQVGPDGR